MKMGFIISHKNNEARRALLPDALTNIKNKSDIIIETGYGLPFGYNDENYINAGLQIAKRKDVFKSDILVDVKLGDADYINELEKGKILVGWAHAVQKIDFTSAAMNGRHTVISWEEICEDGRYVFYRNREIAGEAAVLHGFRYSKKMPYDAKVCIIGNGQTAKGCLRILHGLGAYVDIYPRKFEQLFKKKMFEYDVIINCVMWDTIRNDRLIYKSDLSKFKKGTLIIDVSCNNHLEIETSHPTNIDDPVYEIDGVLHYVVDNTPAMYSETVTKILSNIFSKYVDEIITGKYTKPIIDAIVIKEGCIIREEIRQFRKKRGLFTQ